LLQAPHRHSVDRKGLTGRRQLTAGTVVRSSHHPFQRVPLVGAGDRFGELERIVRRDSIRHPADETSDVVVPYMPRPQGEVLVHGIRRHERDDPSRIVCIPLVTVIVIPSHGSSLHSRSFWVTGTLCSAGSNRSRSTKVPVARSSRSTPSTSLRPGNPRTPPATAR